MRRAIPICAALAASPTLAAADTTNPETPNIIYIVLDDVSVDGIGAYGPDFPTYAPVNRPNTQAIDSLATAGVRFKRAWATPLCSSTRATIQTGLHPFRTGVGSAYGEDVAGLDPDLYWTLAESFANENYATGLFGKHHLGTANAATPPVLGFPALGMFTDAPHPARMGWQRFFGHLGGYPGPDAADPNDGYYKWERVSWLGGSNTGYAAIENNGVHMTDRTIEVASSWINSRTEPFFAMVALNAGHSGTTASSTWTVADVNTDPTKYRTASLSCLAAGTCGATTTRRAYQALVEHADIMIEELLNSMDPATLDNTIIVFVGDNGTPLAAAEGAFAVAGRGKGSTYENGIRVPLIVAEGKAWRTGVPGTHIPVINRVVDAKVHLLDTYNTLHDVVLGFTIGGLDSVSFEDCLLNNDIYCGRTNKGYGYSETFPLSGVAVSNTTKIAVSYGYDTMVACYMPSSTAGAPATGCLQETFYDVSTDPLETAPLAWTGIRAQRLRDYFTTLHTGTGSWAEPAGVVLPFCPAAVVAVCP